MQHKMPRKPSNHKTVQKVKHADVPASWKDELENKIFYHECFPKAHEFMVGQAAQLHPAARLVHGIIHVSDVPIVHAWVELGNAVFDGVLQTFFDKDAYYEYHKAIASESYDWHQSVKMAVETMHYGPWSMYYVTHLKKLLADQLE